MAKIQISINELAKYEKCNKFLKNYKYNRETIFLNMILYCVDENGFLRIGNLASSPQNEEVQINNSTSTDDSMKDNKKTETPKVVEDVTPELNSEVTSEEPEEQLNTEEEAENIPTGELDPLEEYNKQKVKAEDYAL